MIKIPFTPESVTADNPDVRRMLGMLESGFRFEGTAPRCPVCGGENMYIRVVCNREYCTAVWKAVRKLFRSRTKPNIQTRPETLSGPLRAATPEEWRERNRPIRCKRMSATLSVSHCGMSWQCFDPHPCDRVPRGRRRPQGTDV